MEQQIIENDGLQYVPQIAVQYVYLDFDGESTTYRNEDLNITIKVDVDDSGMSDEQKRYILAELSEKLNVKIAILSVPCEHAQQAADHIAESGLKAIWNFTNTPLALPPDMIQQRVNMAGDLAELSVKLSGKMKNNTDI